MKKRLNIKILVKEAGIFCKAESLYENPDLFGIAGGNLPADEITRYRLANEILKNPPEQGYLTISNALQWRLQYQRIVDLKEDIEGIIDGFVKSPLVPEGSLRGKDAKTAKFFINIKLVRLLIIYCFLTISWCLGAFVATFYDCINISIQEKVNSFIFKISIS